MSNITFLWLIIQWLFWGYFLFFTLYLTFFAIAAHDPCVPRVVLLVV